MSAKITKNSAYFSRFQVPFRRRREGKTDYEQRASLIRQDGTKFGARKYRLVARITNRKVIAQVVYAEIDHDVTIADAASIELVKYGIKLGLTNYASAYATGLLVARRLLQKLNLDKVFTKPIPGTIPEDEDEDKRRPFKAVLDVGLRRTTTGARVFAVMKGAADGGLFIPHSDDRLAGSTTGKRKSRKQVEEDEDGAVKGKGGKPGAKGPAKPAAKAPAKPAAPAKGAPAAKAPAGKAPAGKAPAKGAAKEEVGLAGLDKNSFRYYILGGHVAAYMIKLRDENPAAYNRQFGKYIAAGIKPEDIPGLYQKAHREIRANPAPADGKKWWENRPKKPKQKKVGRKQSSAAAAARS
jgi:ribosomal protein L18